MVDRCAAPQQILFMKVVCAIIENPTGEVLVCQRGSGRKLAGLWEFPGGKIEPGEMAEQALMREIQEELHVEIVVLRVLSAVDWEYDEGSLQLLPYVCRIHKGEPQALEHAQLRWCAVDEFPALDWAPADVPVWQEYALERMR